MREQQSNEPAIWTLFDQRRMRVYGGQFSSEHEAWQARDKAALPSHIMPKRRAEIEHLQ